MATFGITPVAGYPVPPSDSFPQFIQMQADGADLGGPDVDTLNFSTNLTATRGTGENASVVTVTAQAGGGGAAIQFQSQGVDLGGPDADTVDFINGIAADRVGNTIQAFLTTPVFNWNIVDADNYLITGDSVNNGIFMTGAVTTIIVPALVDETITAGFPITIVSEVATSVAIAGNTIDVDIRVPFGKVAATVGDGATVSLRRYSDDVWFLTGDLAAA